LFTFTLTSSYELLLVLGFIEGLGEGFGMTSLIALLTDIAPPSVRGEQSGFSEHSKILVALLALYYS
jgi:MFS family permease